MFTSYVSFFKRRWICSFVSLSEFLKDEEDEGFIFMANQQDNLLLRSSNGVMLKAKIRENFALEVLVL